MNNMNSSMPQEGLWALPLYSVNEYKNVLHRSSEPHLLVKVEFGRSGSATLAPVGWADALELPRLQPLQDIAAATANTYSTRLPGIFREKVGEWGWGLGRGRFGKWLEVGEEGWCSYFRSCYNSTDVAE